MEKMYSAIKIIKKKNKKKYASNQKITGVSKHLSTITFSVNDFNSPIKRHNMADWVRKLDATGCLYKKHDSLVKILRLRVKGGKSVYQANKNLSLAAVVTLLSDKVDKKKSARRGKKKKVSTH